MTAPITDLGRERTYRETAAENELLKAKVAELENQIPAGLEVEGVKRCCVRGNIQLHEEDRTARCKVCGTAVELFRVLMDYAAEDRRFLNSLGYLQSKKATLESAVVDLERQVKNLRAQAGRLAKKASGEPMAPAPRKPSIWDAEQHACEIPTGRRR